MVLFKPVSRDLLLIDEIIEKLQLDLSGKTILTEAGTGHFSLTPLIAIRAKADKVFAWAKDTRFGKATDVIRFCTEIFNQSRTTISKVDFVANARPPEHIRQADIITNLGHVRPLDRWFLEQVKEGAVIPLMCEAWEQRPQDIDIAYCKNNNIRVAGTWESHPGLRIFQACGYLAAKLCFEAGYELYQNRIAIWSGDAFGEVIYDAFEKFYPQKLLLTHNAGDLNQSFDLVVIADYMCEEVLIGENGKIPADLFVNTGVVHLCGKVDYSFCTNHNIAVYPQADGHARRMTQTLSHLGSKPVIDLHAAGLKVGEILFDDSTGPWKDLVQPISF